VARATASKGVTMTVGASADGRPRVIVAGGGIGGLTTALVLHRHGIPVRVFESVRELRALGVGINLLPHSTRVLIDLGLREALERSAILTAELRYHSKEGKTIWVEPRGVAAGNPWPQYSIHRGELQMILLDAVERRIGAENVLTDHHFTGYDEDGDGVVAHFASKQSGELRASVRGDALIGADGLMSQVRAHLYPDEGAPRFSGLMLWRGVVETEPFLGGRSMVMAGHNQLKAVVYPISAEAASRGRSLVNWVAERRVGMNYAHAREDWDRRGDRSDFLEHFRDWDFGWLDFPALIEATEAIYEFPMVDRDPVDRWTFGRVTLLGDAAHAMYPNGSNGASQAILDAEALGQALSEHGEVEAALQAYEAERRPPTTKIVLDNRQTGPERVLQAVEERCDGTCGETHTCIPRDELEEVATSYKRLAGFDVDALRERARRSEDGS
jgi:2-polyprenyl-6-methoxyphenol hydroxylase-like FAD-dependent oxidoreductase